MDAALVKYGSRMRRVCIFKNCLLYLIDGQGVTTR